MHRISENKVITPGAPIYTQRHSNLDPNDISIDTDSDHDGEHDHDVKHVNEQISDGEIKSKAIDNNGRLKISIVSTNNKYDSSNNSNKTNNNKSIKNNDNNCNDSDSNDDKWPQDEKEHNNEIGHIPRGASTLGSLLLDVTPLSQEINTQVDGLELHDKKSSCL